MWGWGVQVFPDDATVLDCSGHWLQKFFLGLAIVIKQTSTYHCFLWRPLCGMPPASRGGSLPLCF